jgi:hypothetical protein
MMRTIAKFRQWWYWHNMTEHLLTSTIIATLLLGINLIALELSGSKTLQWLTRVEDEQGAELGVMYRWPDGRCELSYWGGDTEILPCPKGGASHE